VDLTIHRRSLFGLELRGHVAACCVATATQAQAFSQCAESHMIRHAPVLASAREFAMRALSTFFHATSDTATALLNMASISVAAGAVAAACSAQLRIGLIVGGCALIVSAAGFGFSLWRTYGRRHVFLFRRR
jgi:hypothetical protein